MTVRIEKEDGSRITARGGKWARQIDEKAAATRKARKRGKMKHAKKMQRKARGRGRGEVQRVWCLKGSRHASCEMYGQLDKSPRND